MSLGTAWERAVLHQRRQKVPGGTWLVPGDAILLLASLAVPRPLSHPWLGAAPSRHRLPPEKQEGRSLSAPRPVGVVLPLLLPPRASRPPEEEETSHYFGHFRGRCCQLEALTLQLSCAIP